MKREANANSGRGSRQTSRYVPTASKSSGHASTSIPRAGSSGAANSDRQGTSPTGADSNAGNTFDENRGEARID
jgi:hypothetical protein